MGTVPLPQQTVRFEQFFAAPRPAVFAYFADHEKFGRLWPGRTRRMKDAAGADPNGLGSVREIRRPHFRGGAHAPIPDDELESKYRDNCRFGGWTAQRAAQVADAINALAAGGKLDLSAARG